MVLRAKELRDIQAECSGSVGQPKKGKKQRRGGRGSGSKPPAHQLPDTQLETLELPVEQEELLACEVLFRSMYSDDLAGEVTSALSSEQGEGVNKVTVLVQVYRLADRLEVCTDQCAQAISALTPAECESVDAVNYVFSLKGAAPALAEHGTIKALMEKCMTQLVKRFGAVWKNEILMLMALWMGEDWASRISKEQLGDLLNVLRLGHLSTAFVSYLSAIAPWLPVDPVVLGHVAAWKSCQIKFPGKAASMPKSLQSIHGSSVAWFKDKRKYLGVANGSAYDGCYTEEDLAKLLKLVQHAGAQEDLHTIRPADGQVINGYDIFHTLSVEIVSDSSKKTFVLSVGFGFRTSTYYMSNEIKTLALVKADCVLGKGTVFKGSVDNLLHGEHSWEVARVDSLDDFSCLDSYLDEEGKLPMRDSAYRLQHWDAVIFFKGAGGFLDPVGLARGPFDGFLRRCVEERFQPSERGAGAHYDVGAAAGMYEGALRRASNVMEQAVTGGTAKRTRSIGEEFQSWLWRLPPGYPSTLAVARPEEVLVFFEEHYIWEHGASSVGSGGRLQFAPSSVGCAVGHLSSLMKSIGRRGPYDAMTGLGNPCDSCEVSQYVAGYKRSLWAAGYQEDAAVPLDETKVSALLRDLDGQWYAEPDEFQRLMVERDATMMLYLWYSGMRGKDGGQLSLLDLHDGNHRAVFARGYVPRFRLPDPLVILATRGTKTNKRSRIYQDPIAMSSGGPIESDLRLRLEAFLYHCYASGHGVAEFVFRPMAPNKRSFSEVPYSSSAFTHMLERRLETLGLDEGETSHSFHRGSMQQAYATCGLAGASLQGHIKSPEVLWGYLDTRLGKNSRRVKSRR
eukprot:gene20389-biopygen29161